MNPLTLVLFILGLAILTVGAEVLVRGASRLASRVGVSPLVIGLTVVAYGTSAPELSVSLISAFKGQPDIAIGNVVGSNIFNVLFILGASALFAPLVVSTKIVRLDVPIMILLSLLLLILSLDGSISRLDGLLLFLGAIAYTLWTIVTGKRENNRQETEEAQPERGFWASPLFQVICVLVGIGMLVLGARWLVQGAIEIARLMGVSEMIIGLTVVAAGTSLPELATSVVATIRGERDIAVGNVVGSNIFNILMILGASSLFAPQGIPVASAMLHFDIPIMIAVAAACFPIFFTGFIIQRWEAFIFIAYYCIYTAFLILRATQHDSLPLFSSILLWFLLPLTLLSLLLSFTMAIRDHLLSKRA